MDVRKDEFEKLARENKDTIYTVCYMFSKDRDEVADLYQETLINLWKGMPQPVLQQARSQTHGIRS